MSLLQELIKNRATFILTMERCSDTVRGLEILDKHDIIYKTFKKEDNQEIVDEIIDTYNFKYYPTIFINGEFIGGDKELEVYLKNLQKTEL